jgi:hypothetical protein
LPCSWMSALSHLFETWNSSFMVADLATTYFSYLLFMKRLGKNHEVRGGDAVPTKFFWEDRSEESDNESKKIRKLDCFLTRFFILLNLGDVFKKRRSHSSLGCGVCLCVALWRTSAYLVFIKLFCAL